MSIDNLKNYSKSYLKDIFVIQIERVEPISKRKIKSIKYISEKIDIMKYNIDNFEFIYYNNNFFITIDVGIIQLDLIKDLTYLWFIVLTNDKLFTNNKQQIKFIVDYYNLYDQLVLNCSITPEVCNRIFYCRPKEIKKPDYILNTHLIEKYAK